MHGDQILYPIQRSTERGRCISWPSFSVIIGVTESKTKLEKDAK